MAATNRARAFEAVRDTEHTMFRQNRQNQSTAAELVRGALNRSSTAVTGVETDPVWAPLWARAPSADSAP